LEFLGIGPGELLLILILALVFFGPRRLPEIGAALGKSIREFHRASQDFASQLRGELQGASDEVQAISEDLRGEVMGGAGEAGQGAGNLEG